MSDSNDKLKVGSGDFEVGEPVDGSPLQIPCNPDGSHLSSKDLYELELLKAKIANERRPRWTRAGWWLSALATVAGVPAVGIQYTHSARDLQLSEIRQERAELAQEKAEEAAGDAVALWQSYQDKIGEAQRRLVKLKEKQEEIQELIEAGLRLIVEEARVRDDPASPPTAMMIDPGADITKPTVVGLNHVREQLIQKRSDLQAQFPAFNLEEPPQAQSLERWHDRYITKEMLEQAQHQAQEKR